MADPQTYYDDKKKAITLTDQIGSGGEGVIYQVAGQPSQAAKIYRQARVGIESKVTAMSANPPVDPAAGIRHTSIAWPITPLYDKEQVFAGYIMGRVHNAKLLLTVLNPGRRRKEIPGFTLEYLHHTARNLSAALGAIHTLNYVVGDLNESNVLVKSNALVTLIDTDSFQVRAQNRYGKATTYPCPVGKPEYTPPELQGVAFDRVRRGPEHDSFALGVLIYQLLMNGNHPFKTRWLRADDPPNIGERIRNGWFPHGQPPSFIAAPTNALPFTSLQPELQRLFRRCFVDGHKHPKQRPLPIEWAGALLQSAQDLTICDEGHQFSDHLRRCPYCALQAGLGRKPIPTRKERLTVADAKVNPAPQIVVNRPAAVPAVNPGVVAGAGVSHIPPRQKFTIKTIRKGFRDLVLSGAAVPIGTTAGGMSLGAVLGQVSSGTVAGMIAGGLSGFTSGLYLSELIHTTVGWGIFLGAGLPLVSLLSLWIAGVRTMGTLIPVGVFTIITGIGMGYFFQKLPEARRLTVSLVLGLLAGWLGWTWGQLTAIGWVDGLVAGGVFGGIAGLVYYVYLKIKQRSLRRWP